MKSRSLGVTLGGMSTVIALSLVACGEKAADRTQTQAQTGTAGQQPPSGSDGLGAGNPATAGMTGVQGAAGPDGEHQAPIGPTVGTPTANSTTGAGASGK